MPKNIKINQCCTELFKKIKVARFYGPRCTYKAQTASFNIYNPHNFQDYFLHELRG